MDFNAILTAMNNPSNKVNNRILIIDGLNLFIRSFSVVPLMDNDGNHIGGTLGFLKSLKSLISQHRPSRVIITFDGPGGSVKRRQIYSEYKNNRAIKQKLNRCYDFLNAEQERESMTNQMFQLIKYLENLPVQILIVPNIEADDTIAYCTETLKNENTHIIIVSSDRDYLQLVDKNVSVWSPIKKIMYDEKTVLDEYGIPSFNFLLYKIIVGDTSDNISGIKGVGVKTLIKEFPEIVEREITYHHLLRKLEEVESSKKSMKAISENVDILERNYKLMQLHEVDISGHSKQLILDLLNRKKPPFNRVQLIRQLTSDGIISSFQNLETFLTAFTYL